MDKSLTKINKLLSYVSRHIHIASPTREIDSPLFIFKNITRLNTARLGSSSEILDRAYGLTTKFSVFLLSRFTEFFCGPYAHLGELAISERTYVCPILRATSSTRPCTTHHCHLYRACALTILINQEEETNGSKVWRLIQEWHQPLPDCSQSLAAPHGYAHQGRAQLS